MFRLICVLAYLLICVLAYLCSGLPMFRLAYTSSAAQPTWLSVVSIVIVIVHHQFKQNIYFSLLCDWIFLCLQNHFSFLSSKYAGEACDNNTADIVHFSSHVQASQVVMHLFLCC